jgi:hypothetical protein
MKRCLLMPIACDTYSDKRFKGLVFYAIHKKPLPILSNVSMNMQIYVIHGHKNKLLISI